MGLAERVDAAIDAALESRIVGCVVLVHRAGKRLYGRAAGFADREAARPTQEDTIFRLASVTKPIVATAALRMIDLGLLSLDDPVTKYLPFFAPRGPDGTAPTILIRHLLTHISGLVYGQIPEDVSRGADPGPLIQLEENLRRLARGTLAFDPGTAWGYGMSIDVLGGVIGAINGNVSDVEAALRRHVLDPLQMNDTRFGVTDASRLAAAYGDAVPAPIRMAEPQRMVNADGGVEMMSPDRIFNPQAPQSGGAGMAGTAGDFMRLLEAVGGGFLSVPLRATALSVQTGALPMDRPGQGYALIGAAVTDPVSSGWHKQGLIQWGGIWGNSWILDPATQTAVVAFTNTMWDGCNGRFRDDIRDAVFG